MSHVLVVGSGIAGLWAAIRASDAGHSVELVTKTTLASGCTPYAQGGVAAALFADDAADRHFADTVAAGAGLADPAAVRILVDEGPARVRDLIRFGVEFDHDASGLARGLEGAHSRARIVHAGGDSTGAAIERALVETVRRRAVRVHEHTMLVDLVTTDGAVTGVRLLAASDAPFERSADEVVLATGGNGCLYLHTTNPDVATGDGAAAAWRAGAVVTDLEFTQFHPTALAIEGTPLISEAVRGDGAVLRGRDGRRFMFDVDARGELAPRDVVARAVWRQMASDGGHPVLLDATSLGASRLAERFPALDALCRSAGLDWSREPVPVTPAAHYAMGGVVTDLDGRTSVPGLWAVGEVARTGVHGANRLASNSLLEAAVFAERVASGLGTPRLGGASCAVPRTERHPGRADAASGVSSRASGRSSAEVTGVPTLVVDRSALRQLMWRHVGLERDAAGLAAASARLAEWHARLRSESGIATDESTTESCTTDSGTTDSGTTARSLTMPDPTDANRISAPARRALEDRNLLDLARLTVAAASARLESVGAHWRRDAPRAGEQSPAHQTAAHQPSASDREAA